MFQISPSARKIWQERNKKLKTKIKSLKNEVQARDMRVALLEDAVGSLSDLCTQSQHAYYVSLIYFPFKLLLQSFYFQQFWYTIEIIEFAFSKGVVARVGQTVISNCGPPEN
jgi:hypothetical protein